MTYIEKTINYSVISKFAFTLAEVLIVLGIIGIIAEMTIPTLMNNVQQQTYVSGVLKFNSTLHQAVDMWKQDISCYSSANSCLSQQNLADNTCSNFDQISKFMRITDKVGTGTADWLPATTSNYAGVTQTGVWGGVSNYSSGLCKYLLSDGMTFAMDVDANQFGIWVDVNGKKPPNRIGKDTFTFTVGGSSTKDISYYPVASEAVRDTEGLCAMNSPSCDPTNINPSVSNGASPTAYIITTQKAPNYY